jgi:hypothetical protein
LLILGNAACGDETQGRTIIIENVGRICLYASATGHQWYDPSAAGPQSFAPDQPIFVQYASVETCPGDPCYRDLQVSCGVHSGSEISSFATWINVTAGEEPSCFSECVSVVAECPTDPVPAGHYSFNYAGKLLELDVPSTLPEPLCVTVP